MRGCRPALILQRVGVKITIFSRMNQFRENLSSLLEDGLPMSFSELQYKYETAFGPLDEPICTLENIRRLGTVQRSLWNAQFWSGYFLVFLGDGERPNLGKNIFLNQKKAQILSKSRKLVNHTHRQLISA